ncbi:MAG: metallophosphoesterase [Bacteroidales bacterium]|nr:metallophosphoesterase [Bacteroidales bacterium]
MKKLFILKRSILTLLVILGCSSVAAKDISIYVATDLHVMSPDLIVNKGSAWDNYISSSHKLEDYSVDLFQNMIDTILSQMPDIVMIPGDISKDGEKLSHEYVTRELSRLTDAGIKVYVVPGNHDIGNIENAQYFDGSKRYKAENITAAEFAEMYASFGYEGSTRDENSLSYAAEPVDGLVIIGIDSHSRKISKKTLDWICEQSLKAREEDKQVIAMMHHPIMEHFNGQIEMKSDAIIKDDENIRSRLMDAGIHMVFTGHFHTTDVAMAYNENHTDSIYDITTGSKISYPMHHRWVNLSEDMSRMDINTFVTDAIDGHPEVIDVAKERIEKNINAKLENKGLSFMSSVACQATFLHCEGNENEANGVNLIDSIPFVTFVLYPEAWEDMNSLLDDFSSYGENDQNRTNDLRLSIKLKEVEIDVPASISEITADKKDEHLYNLMGQRVEEKTHGIVIQGGKKLIQKNP